MGWLQRRGTIGSTARWVAKTYNTLRAKEPDLEELEIYRMMIELRYVAWPNDAFRCSLLELEANDKKEPRGLALFTASILMVESKLMPTIGEFVKRDYPFEIVEEELEKQGLAKWQIEGGPRS